MIDEIQHDYYKKLFKIHRELMKYHIPDDIVPIIYEYIGNLNESEIDLANKWCFYIVKHNRDFHDRLTNKFLYTKENVILGYYCTVCGKIYKFEYPSQFNTHTNGSYHKNRLKKIHYDPLDPTLKQIQVCFSSKHPYFWRLSIDKKKKYLDSVKYEHYLIKK